jgi:hypothetical protein
MLKNAYGTIILNRGAAVKSTTDFGPHIRFVRRKGAAAEEMILQIISGRAENIRTTVASFAESYGINCQFVQSLNIFFH